jgi:hypothetical protein
MAGWGKKCLKFFGLGVLWVYILSIRVGDGTIFHHANDVLVQNQIVEAIDEQLAQGWESLTTKASNMFARLTGGSEAM